MTDEQETPTRTDTPVPAGGWNETHIGQEVVYTLPFGTVVHDTIIEVEFMGNIMIGPAVEIGGVIARRDFVEQTQIAMDEWQQRLSSFLPRDDDDEDDGGIPV